MIILLKTKVTAIEEKTFRQFLVDRNVDVIRVERNNQILFVVTGRCSEHTMREVSEQKQVSTILEIDRPYKLSSRLFTNLPSQISIKNGLKVGGKEIVFMAGPCSVETKDQIFRIAKEVKDAGCQVLRGGAFKPRTGPYDFQGLGKVGLHFLREAADFNHLKVITEIIDIRDIELVEKYTDIFQVGTRNMQNYPLLRELGKTRKPVVLKRGMWATYKELLLAAEYILIGGNDRVILCERGIRTHVTETRFTLDLNAVPYLKHESHLPVIVDPSHGTGKASLVRPMSRAAIAAGCDGLLLEVHYDPRESISDADQAISTQELKKLIKEVKKVAVAVDRV